MCARGKCTLNEAGCSRSGGVKYRAEVCAPATKSPSTIEPTTGDPSDCNPNDLSDGLVCKSGKVAPLGQWSACGNGREKFSERKYCPPGFFMCAKGKCTKSQDGCRFSGGIKYGAKRCSTISPTSNDGGILEATCAALTCNNNNELCIRRRCDTNDACAVVRLNGDIRCVPRRDVPVEDVCAALNRRRVSWTRGWCKTEKACVMKRRGRKWRCIAKSSMS